ncbi:hypothetical protein FRB99_003596 [Tulasnella sp. 403]|nr:hypothetical protein FRB99_003596 [Tulasnella sp. 403]
MLFIQCIASVFTVLALPLAGDGAVISSPSSSGIWTSIPPQSTPVFDPCAAMANQAPEWITFSAVSNSTELSGLVLNNIGGPVVLTQFSRQFTYNTTNGGLGYPWCPTTNWLNILPSSSSWKPLEWTSNQTTATWTAAIGGYLTANATATYAQSDDFMACCPPNAGQFPAWTLYLLVNETAPEPLTVEDGTKAPVNGSSMDQGAGASFSELPMVKAWAYIIPVTPGGAFLVTPGLCGPPAPTTVAEGPAPSICPATFAPVPVAPIVAKPAGTLVSGLQVGILADGTAVLTAKGLNTSWTFGNGGLGQPWCPTGAWLNIEEAPTPWKPCERGLSVLTGMILTSKTTSRKWSQTQVTTNWKASPGSFVIATATSTYSETGDFLACQPLNSTAEQPLWKLYLLADGILPSPSVFPTDEVLNDVDVQTCVKTQLYLERGTGYATAKYM